MRFKLVGIIIKASLLCGAVSFASHSQTQRIPESAWNLPQGLAVMDAGPRVYTLTVEYTSANTRGEIFQRQRLAAEYTRGLPGGDVMWKNVTRATANGATSPFGPPEKLDFMEGFRYRNDFGDTMRADFFKAFPPSAVMERNLVWDTGMIEMFGQNYFDRLKLNQPYHAISNADTDLPSVGKFHNRDVVLQWVGLSKRNGHECAVIDYQAFFNPLDIAVGGMTMKGRSDYWGEIWVSLSTKQIEYGTLYESVVAEMKTLGQQAPQTVNIFRNASLEPVSAK
jgi:hypothetical protein